MSVVTDMKQLQTMLSLEETAAPKEGGSGNGSGSSEATAESILDGRARPDSVTRT